MNTKSELILFLRSNGCEIINEDEYGIWYKYKGRMNLVPVTEDSIKLVKKQLKRNR